jgi:1-aminocyclopropane-1-carboxylate deaminase/D-cysteine desulfhydrase-like pyridoxal-dependent ACC family enzyme
MTPDELQLAAERLPRVRLAHLPTPLEELPRFRQALGGPRIFIKRDDCTGLLYGGNKARHNEFLLGDAKAQGADMLVWGASVQSNNCRQTAAACAKLGLECRLYLSTAETQNTTPQGNLLLDYLVGAQVEFTPAKLGPELNAVLAEKADFYRSQGRKPYVWNPARVVPLAAVSYALCVAEIVRQHPHFDALYVSSAGATGAGVVLGKKALGVTAPARLIAPITWPWNTAQRTAEDARVAAQWLGLDLTFDQYEIDVDESQIAPGYGLASPAGREALNLLARTEGILLDPVYSAKAMAALIADIRLGKYTPDQDVVFIHTGGTPVVFAQPESVWP